MVQSDNRQDSSITGIELKNIKKSFDNLVVLDDLSLIIRRSELCCLLGPSGCGKTTILKIINGLMEADSGKVFLLGQDITGITPQKRNLGMVFQNYALFPQMNVYENIAYGLKRRKIPESAIREKVTAALEVVRLQNIEKRRIHELSGGQQQRIALARAMVIEPQALLLDEPLSNLDAKLREDMRSEIRRIQRQLGITMVYVTHDQEEAMSIADRIVVMNNGKIEQIGTPEDVYEKPATRFVADFIGHSNFISGVIEKGSLVIMGKKYETKESNLPDGTKVIGTVRQERIRLDLSHNSALIGEVKEATYFGSMVRYQIAIESEKSLTAELPAAQASAKTGDIVGIEIRPEDIRIFPDES